MAAKLLFISRIDPNYLLERLDTLKKSYNNAPGHLNKKSRYHFIVQKGGCHLFDTMSFTSEYKYWSLQARGVRTTINISIFIYFMHHGMDKDVLPVVNKTEISHLCHHRACVNPAHLNLESTGINNERRVCRSQNRCKGHLNEPPCYFVG